MSDIQKPRDTTLSGPMKLNIAILSGVGLISIILLLFGTFDHKFTRIFTTIFLFGVFTIIATFGPRFSGNVPIKLVVAQAGNVFGLAVGLISTWGSVFKKESQLYGDGYYDNSPNFFAIVLLLIVVQLGVLAIQKTASSWNQDPEVFSIASRIATLALAATVILLTLPIGLGNFITFENAWYWKITGATTLIGGLGVSIMTLIWAVVLRDKTPKVTIPAQYGYQNNTPVGVDNFPTRQYPTANNAGINPAAPHLPVIPQAPQNIFPVYGQHYNPTPTTNIPAVPPMPIAAQAPVAEKLPWPLMPDGSPVPKLENGWPDLNAQQAAQYSQQNNGPIV